MKMRLIAAIAGAAAVMLSSVLPCFAAFREEPVGIPLYVAVKADGSGETCRIVIESTDGFEEDRILSVKEGKRRAADFRMEEPGSRTYRIYQLAGTRKNVEYDETIYTAVFFAWMEGGKLQGTVILGRDGESEKPAEVLFCNTAAPSPGQPPEPSVKTGDETHTRLWSGIGLAAAAAGGVLLLMQKRRKR